MSSGPWTQYQQQQPVTQSPQASDAPATGSPDDVTWRATFLPFGQNRKGENTLAVPQIAMDAYNAVTLPGDVYNGKVDVNSDEGLARVIGLAGLGSISSLPMLPGRAINAAGKAISPQFMRTLERDNISPANLASEVKKLGPGGKVADLGQNLQLKTAELAAEPGDARSIIAQGLEPRNLSARTRIQRATNAFLGPAVSPDEANTQIATALRKVGRKMYPAAFKADDVTAVNTQGLAERLEAGAVNARGPAQAAANNARELLNIPGTSELDPLPEALLSTRKAIDGLIGSEMNRDVKRVLTDTRRNVDTELARAVPGIKKADEAYASVAKQREAFETGQQIFDSGRASPWPQQRAAARGDMNRAQQRSMTQGARSEIERIIGTKANDRGGLRDILRGEGSWNRDKLVNDFGAKKADKIIGLFENEARMQQTENLALSGSKTGALKAAKEDTALQEGATPAGIFRNAANFKPGDAAKVFVDYLTAGRTARNRDLRNADLARLLMGKGEDIRMTPSRPPPISRIPAYGLTLQDLIKGLHGNK